METPNMTDQIGLSAGRHIVYTYTDHNAYLENITSFIIEGLEMNQQIVCAEQPENAERILRNLEDRGFSKNQLKELVFLDANVYYGAHDRFNIEYINENYLQLVEPHLDYTRDIRLWGSVVWKDQDEEFLKTQIHLYEHDYDSFVSQNPNVLVVCAYNALKLSASFLNIILQTHNFHMTDNDLSLSHLYKKEPFLLSRIAEQIRLQETEGDAAVRSEKLAIASKLAEVAAHELGNPLGVIKGFLQLLDEADDISDTNRLYLNAISSQLDRIGQISTEFLALANPKLGNKKEINIASSLECVKNQMETQAASKDIEIKINCPEDDIYIVGNKEKIKQAISNIIKNAIEAMDAGSILLEAKELDGYVHIYVTDNGPGIPERFIHHIGEPLITEKESGVGLGLLISKKIIAAHDGKFAVESKAGKGTTFTMSLPKE